MALLRKPRGRLFRKYAVYFVILVSAALLASGLSGLYFSYQENRTALLSLQREKALGAASRIEQYIKEIEHQIGWTRLPQASTTAMALEQRRLDYLKLLRQVPAITEISRLDGKGQEQLRVSRLEMDVAGSGTDFSQDPKFRQAESGKTYFGPIYFRKETEPYMTIAISGGREDPGVTVVEVNLKFVWDVVSRIKIGQAGHAYVVDTRGRLISHPDIGLVLQKTDFSALPQVRAALVGMSRLEEEQEEVTTARDREGVPVLTAFAPIAPLGWVVFVEQPQAEAFAPLYALVTRTGLLLLLGLVLSVVVSLILARKMVTPIRALQSGAAQIGAGTLDHRIEVRTGDELESLAEQFNHMAVQLQESYANLEQKVIERTHQLELANQTKSRFLAAASHDLRQPMHALGLFIAQLRDKVQSHETLKIVEQAQASIEALGELFNALLDISKLDAGVLAPNIENFPINTLLKRMENDFAEAARNKGLAFRTVLSQITVHSDPVLLERILLNLVANAVRYTSRGGILIGCRRRGPHARIEVWDTGIGIPKERQQEIFQEFHQLANPERDHSKGLGLGLAIVQRLARLLQHPIELTSTPRKGSVFTIEVPIGAAQRGVETSRPISVVGDCLAGAFVVVVDDDALVQDGMRGLLTGWGCHVVTASTGDEALARLEEHERLPDVFICDYRLPEGKTGIQVIERLHANSSDDIPAVLISGDTALERLREARESGYPLLHKPVQPAKLRALLSQLLSSTIVNDRSA